MFRQLTFLTGFLMATVASQALAQPASTAQADVVVYGCTPAGIAAAVEVKRHGHSVSLLCPGGHIGGMSTNGLGFADAGDHDAIGGLALKFYRDLKARYAATGYTGPTRGQTAESRSLVDRDTMWIFEPHVAEAVYGRWLQEARVRPIFNQKLVLDPKRGVTKDGARIRQIRTLDGHVYKGRMFIDATYEGDLLAMAGVSFTTGREANAKYGETLNGIQVAGATNHQFVKDVDPYRVPGDPSSGLLPGIDPKPAGIDGEGDERLQAYNYRLCMTKSPANRKAFQKPEGYDPMRYEVLARYLDVGFRGPFGIFSSIPGGKTDTNNYGGFSTDNIGMNYAYPTADYAERAKIADEHRRYQEGFFWFLQNDPRAPADVRQSMAPWGLCADEFTDNGGWPRELYVREARRMVSDLVMTENHLRGLTSTPEPIGLGSYNLDSHNVRRYVDARGHVRNEGNIEISPGRVYGISYRAIVPKRAEAANLLAPVAVSASHIAYGSIRMEPVFTILGQSAGAAASQALDDGIAVQSVDYGKLKETLLREGQVLDPPAH